MVSLELIEDPQTANYDVTVIGLEITNCEKELVDAKVQAPQLLTENRLRQYYITMGGEITSSLELENQNEY
ncbi:hypothetical protein Goari_009603 [Gossypium aridum]|uniref:Uncharacterized protein n=1 Tax=Gossypium aridum TaxID=34290 RepID=A0A7J8XXS5_GOSAI|nr:hypothetical protein [Gossypium aridum]